VKFTERACLTDGSTTPHKPRSCCGGDSASSVCGSGGPRISVPRGRRGAMNVLGSAAIVQSTDRAGAVSRFAAIFGAPPLHEFQIDGRDLSVSVFPRSSPDRRQRSRRSPICGRRSSSGHCPRRRPSCGQAAGRPRVRSAAGRACWLETPTGTRSSSSRNPARRGDLRRICRRR
jgi:hypothetical protein